MSAFVRKGDFWSGLAMAALGAYVVSQSLRWDYTGKTARAPDSSRCGTAA